MRTLLLSRYNVQGASSRLRTLQYVDGLEQRGFEIEVHHLFRREYLDHLYTGAALPLGSIVAAYFRRAALALQGGNWDLLWVEKELLPWIPSWLETFLLPEGTALVLDYDDAIFHRYDQHPRPGIGRIKALLVRIDQKPGTDQGFSRVAETHAHRFSYKEPDRRNGKFLVSRRSLISARFISSFLAVEAYSLVGPTSSRSTNYWTSSWHQLLVARFRRATAAPEQYRQRRLERKPQGQRYPAMHE